MRVPHLFVLVLLAAAAPACKTRTPVAVDTTEVADIPREVALQKLRELLPTAEYVYCTKPKDSPKRSDIRAWHIRSDGVEIEQGKSLPLLLFYRHVTEVKLELVGRYYTARIFSSMQPDKEKPHFEFLWKEEAPAKSVVELFVSLTKK